ncbi:hypothetical protein [Mycoplasma sp. SG1]|uniref:hypothetical protein n=1 Tax=Mycoplasma sp. SG1 TaxID=2810348 RepID=UPI0020251985|nr:hypothetical protein [Mycoplasma sp. SG1]URM53172.1 hypothetical protein JRW51_02385 [Mycoplasma sp. SG1]
MWVNYIEDINNNVIDTYNLLVDINVNIEAQNKKLDQIYSILLKNNNEPKTK